MAAFVSASEIWKVSAMYLAIWLSRSFWVRQWNMGISNGMPKRSCGSSELRMTRGYPFTTAHMDWLVSEAFSEGTEAMEGRKMRSTFCFARLRRCPCTSLAGKHTVSEVTAESPLSYMVRLLGAERRMVKPRLRKKVLQKGMVSQKASTRGSPMTVFLSAGFVKMG